MALVKPIHIGKGVTPSYHKIENVTAIVGCYMNRNERENDDSPIMTITLDLIASGIVDKAKLYEALKALPPFDGAVDEHSSAPIKQNEASDSKMQANNEF